MKQALRALTSIVLLVSVLVVGCAPQAEPTVVPTTAPTAVPPTAAPEPTNTVAQPTPAEAQPTEAAAEASLEIVDDLGRSVTITEVPQRVVSLAPSLTEVLFAVGAGDQVVGVTSYCTYPEAATTVQQVGGYSASSISTEQIVALEPDVVFAGGAIHQPIIDTLEPMGIAVVALDPLTIEQVGECLVLVGEITGHADEANAAADEMAARIQTVVDAVSAVPQDERVTVYWQIWDDPLMSATSATFPGQLIELAGGTNIFADLEGTYPQISEEAVVEASPQVIMGPDTHGDRLTPEVFGERPGWDGIRAVQDGRIYLLDGDTVSRGGPRLADALEDVAAALYPEYAVK